MEIEVTLSKWSQCIFELQESERRIKNVLSDIEAIHQQLRSSEDPALIMTDKAIEKQITELHRKIQEMRTLYSAMEKIKSVYLESEAFIEDGLSVWVEPDPGVQIMPGLADRDWLKKIQSEIKLKG